MKSRFPRPAGPMARSRIQDPLAGLVGTSQPAPTPRDSKGKPPLKVDRSPQTFARIERFLSKGWNQALIERIFAKEGKSLPLVTRERIWMRLNGEKLTERLQQEHSLVRNRSWDPSDYGRMSLDIAQSADLSYLREQMRDRIEKVLNDMEKPPSMKLGNSIRTFAEWEYLKPEIVLLYQWTQKQNIGRNAVCKEMIRRYGSELRNSSYTSFTTKIEAWLGGNGQSSHPHSPSAQSTPRKDVETPFSATLTGRTPRVVNDDREDSDDNLMAFECAPPPLKYPVRSPTPGHNGPASVIVDYGESDSGSHSTRVSRAESIVSAMSETLDQLIGVGYLNWPLATHGVSATLLPAQDLFASPQPQQMQHFQDSQGPFQNQVHQQALVNTQEFRHNSFSKESFNEYNNDKHPNSGRLDGRNIVNHPVLGCQEAIHLPIDHLPVGHHEDQATQVQSKPKSDSEICMVMNTHDDCAAVDAHKRNKPSSLERPVPIATADDLINLVPESHMQGPPFTRRAVASLCSLDMLQAMPTHNLHRLAACINQQAYDQTMKSLAEALRSFNPLADTFDHNSNTPGHIALSNPLDSGAAEVATLHWIETWLDKSGVHVDEPNSDGETLLHLAAKNGFHSVVMKLLQRHAEPECRTKVSLDRPYELGIAASHRMGQDGVYYSRLFNCVMELRKAMNS